MGAGASGRAATRPRALGPLLSRAARRVDHLRGLLARDLRADEPGRPSPRPLCGGSVAVGLAALASGRSRAPALGHERRPAGHRRRRGGGPAARPLAAPAPPPSPPGPHRADVPQGRDPGRRRPGRGRRRGSRPGRPSACRRSPTTRRRRPTEPEVSEADAAMIRACVIWRDDDVIALNKPPGLAVQGGSGQRRHVDGLAEALRFGRPDKPRLVHRLDRDTSGVLLLARSARAAAGLARAFQARDDAQGLLGGGRRRAVAAGRHDPLRPRQGAGPRRRRRGREDARACPPTGSPPPRGPSARRPTTR